ncbi:MAG TPA: hypothetical protein VOB72_18495 [Candidatus Dormibacteraeota bacterium]|nr:hypothetical protein [Candidatus Dormibacteraeota bacterium]
MAVTRVGGTGHRLLPAATARLVEPALRELLGRCAGADGLVGVTLLDDGADLLFAQAILALGGALEVVLPASRYRDGLPVHSLGAFDELLARATRIRRLPYVESTSEAHMAAGQVLVERADVVIAVWDGRPARGVGGTGDVVAYARARGVPVEVIWPPGASRD